MMKRAGENAMQTPSIRQLKITVIVLACLFAGFAEESDGQTMQDEASYTNDIRPIVNNFCTTCHAGDDPEGEFVLTSYEDVLKHTKKGELLKRINDAEEPMPQKRPDANLHATAFQSVGRSRLHQQRQSKAIGRTKADAEVHAGENQRRRHQQAGLRDA